MFVLREGAAIFSYKRPRLTAPWERSSQPIRPPPRLRLRELPGLPTPATCASGMRQVEIIINLPLLTQKREILDIAQQKNKKIGKFKKKNEIFNEKSSRLYHTLNIPSARGSLAAKYSSCPASLRLTSGLPLENQTLIQAAFSPSTWRKHEAALNCFRLYETSHLLSSPWLLNHTILCSFTVWACTGKK